MRMLNEELALACEQTEPNAFKFRLGIYSAHLMNCRIDGNGDWIGELELRAPVGRVYWGKLAFSSVFKRREIVSEFLRRTRDRSYNIELALEIALRHAIEVMTALPTWDWQPGVKASQRYLIHPLLPDRVVSVLAGDGGAGKGYFALLMASIIASGSPAAGFTPGQGKANVLYLDYESTKEDIADRIERVATGHGFPKQDMRIRYMRADAPYSFIHQAVRREVANFTPALLIIDSLGPALGSFTDGAGTAIEVMRKLRELDCAVLAIAHIAKAQVQSKEPTPYGSVFIKNLARNVWILSRESYAENIAHIAVKHIKSNLAPLGSTILLRVVYETDSVRFETLTVEERMQYDEHLSLNERVLYALDKPRTAAEIAEMLQVNQIRVSQTLAALEKAGRVTVVSGRGVRGDPYKYAIIDPASVFTQTVQQGSTIPEEEDPFA